MKAMKAMKAGGAMTASAAFSAVAEKAVCRIANSYVQNT